MKAIILFLAVSSTAMAADYDAEYKRYGYESAAGAKYQYDLTKPADELRYQNDYAAQHRDSIESLRVNPVRELKEEIYGQTGRGGGIYR